MHLLRTLALAALLSHAAAGDWPTHRHDAQRSGHTADALPVDTLGLAWAWQSPQPPQPAWHGPAKWDAYHNLRGLKSMRNYDPVFHVVAAGDALYFGSSADDAVRCLDAKTGKLRWAFVTDGPVRMAPTVADGRVYFGSDDGHAYCLRASDGALVWKHSPRPGQRLVLNNGRLISFWPVRTGVLVADGTACYAASLLPWKESYLCAVDAVTGQPTGPGRYAAKFDGVTMEGALLASSRLLVVPQGRVPPLLFQRTDGKRLAALKGGGGCFVLLAEDDQLLHGPGNKAGWITASNTATGATLATYPSGNAMVVAGNVAYVLTDKHLAAFDRAKKQRLWQAACSCPYELILAGDVLFAGGTDAVAAFRSRDGQPLWTQPVRGRAYGLAVANGALYASTDEGQIACFRAGATRAAAPSVTKPVVQPPAVEPNADAALAGRWAFHRSQLDAAKKRVTDQAGKSTGTLLGKAAIVSVGELDALQLDGKTASVLLAADHKQATLPTQAITVEAWVRVDAPLDWGGIIGAIQDNGKYERGWLLGYIKDRFAFGLAATGGADTLGYLKSKTAFRKGAWYHVAGTYDGKTKRLYVNGTLEATATDQSGPINYPPKTFYEIGAYHDDNEYFRMAGQIHEVCVYRRTLSADEVAHRHQAKRQRLVDSLPLAARPRLRFVAPDAAIVQWHTDEPSPSILEYGQAGAMQRVEGARPKTSHALRLAGLRKNRIYAYRIEGKVDGQRILSPAYECDTFFNHAVAAVAPDAAVPAPLAHAARQVLAQAPSRRGICLALGVADAPLLLELARQSELRVIAVVTAPEAVAQARAAVAKAGVYGTRVTVRHAPSLASLPFPQCFADVVVVAPAARQHTDAALPLLRPGGVLVASDGTGAKLVPGALPGAGEWSHQYGRPDNSAFGGETLGGAASTTGLEVQWLGRPGPRAQADRNGRKPSPLAINGRLFLQGLQRITAVNAFNGTILWTLEIPDLLRFNVPRDCSNWCADADHLYAAVGDEVWQLDAATGALVRRHSVLPGPRKDWAYDWGYVARAGDKLLGSAVKHASAYTNFWGSAGWYDAPAGPLAAKVCSDNLFALTHGSSSVAWSYSQGIVINSTVTVGDGRVYFVESRNREVRDADARRVTSHELWQSQVLVALDLDTGRMLWERLVDTTDGQAAFYLAHGDGKLALVSSGDKRYHVAAFDAATGKPAWEQRFGWPGGKSDHGNHLSRPAIVGGKLFVRPQVFALDTGQPAGHAMPRGGCGTYAAAAHAFIFRAGSVALWNPATGKATKWPRLRPDCWVSTIPACGMLLSPEGGGGCSCGAWMETSLGFLPVPRPKP